MVRGRRRRLPGAPAALRWVAADARDVARIHGSSAGPVVAVPADVAVPTVAGGLKSWQRRVERRRLLALARRAALAGVGAACALQLGALASGSDGPGFWLLPAAIVAAVSVAVGLAHRTSAAAAARLLDRDLELGAGVSTALELETSVERASARRGLGALVLADGRGALGRSMAGARARLQPRRGEVALLGALVAALAVLLLVPSPRSGSPAVTAAAPAKSAKPGNRALRAENGLPGSAAAATLQGFKQTRVEAPSLAAVGAGGLTRTGGAASGRSRYGGGVANDSQAGGVEPTSSTVGQGGAVKGTQATAGSSSTAGEGKGSNASGSAGARRSGSAGGAGTPGAAGGKGVAPVSGGRPASSQGRSSLGGKAGKQGGKPRGASGASEPGTAPGRTPNRSAPGGSTPGTAPGAKSAGHGVVPQLRGRSGLPLAPAYEAVPGSSGARGVSASPTAGGGGGAGHSGQANAGAAGSGAGVGVTYVPPGGAAVAPIDRGVVLGYFGSFARVNSSGW